MSYGLDVVLAPLRAFALFLLGTEIRFETLCSIGSAYSESRMGHGFGQEPLGSDFTRSRKLCHEEVPWIKKNEGIMICVLIQQVFA